MQCFYALHKTDLNKKKPPGFYEVYFIKRMAFPALRLTI